MQHAIAKLIKNELFPMCLISALLCASIGIVRFCIIPLKADLGKKQAALQSYGAVISTSGATDTIDAMLKTQQRALINQYRALYGESGGARDLAGLLRILITTAQAAGVQFVKMQPEGGNAPEEADKTYTVLLDFSASYHSLGTFTSSLEAMPHRFRIDRLALERGKGNDINVKMLVKGYFSDY
jgi:hypothetical protein